MDDSQLENYRAKRGMEILHFPTVLGADVPTHNISGVNAELKFTTEVLAGIFLGRITKWSDPQLTKINADANLPNRDIIVVFRSDGSGTTYIWSDHLAKVSGGHPVACPTAEGVGGCNECLLAFWLRAYLAGRIDARNEDCKAASLRHVWRQTGLVPHGIEAIPR